MGNVPSVDVPYARRHNLQQMTVKIPKIEHLTSIFPYLTQLNRDALFLQPTFPSRQITASDPERDVNCAAGVRVRSGAFLEEQQHASITRTHRAQACLIVQGFAAFERLKAEYSSIHSAERDGLSTYRDVSRIPFTRGGIAATLFMSFSFCRAEQEDHDLTT